MTYQGTPVIGRPEIFKIDEEQPIRQYIGNCIADYVSRHIEINMPMILENIACRFVELDEEEIYNILEFNRISVNLYRFRGMKNVMSDLEAKDYIRSNFKKLLLTCDMK